MKTRKILVNVDFYVQMFLFIVAAASGLFALIEMDMFILLFGAVLFVLGFWQVMSALILGIMLSDGKRAQYLVLSFFYVAIFILTMSVVENGRSGTPIFIWVAFGGLIPLGFAFYYLRLTRHSLKELEDLGEIVKMPKELDDVLDSEEIFKPIERL